MPSARIWPFLLSPQTSGPTQLTVFDPEFGAPRSLITRRLFDFGCQKNAGSKRGRRSVLLACWEATLKRLSLNCSHHWRKEFESSSQEGLIPTVAVLVAVPRSDFLLEPAFVASSFLLAPQYTSTPRAAPAHHVRQPAGGGGGGRLRRWRRGSTTTTMPAAKWRRRRRQCCMWQCCCCCFCN